jgi:hypothetical protein
MQNFGQIHETFKDILIDGIVEGNNKNRKVFKAYAKTLKENSTLRVQFEVYDSLENKVNEDLENSKLFVDECLSLLSKLDVNKVNECNNKLTKFLNKNGYMLIEDYDNKELHEHIYRLTVTPRSAKNLSSIVESRMYLNNFTGKKIMTENTKVEPYTNKFLAPIMIEKFNKKYSTVSESEKKVIRTIINGDESQKKDLYKTTIRECLDVINTKLKEECSIEEKDTFLRVKDKVLRYDYNPETFISEMTELSYLKETLN